MRLRSEKSPAFLRATPRPRFTASRTFLPVSFMKEDAMENERPDDLKNVWQNQTVEANQMSLDELRRKAGKFQKRIRNRNLREYAASVVVVAVFCYNMWRLP